LIEPAVVADVDGEVIGVLEKFNVERGDRVKKGQAIAELDARVESAAFTAAHAIAGGRADLLSAESVNEFARRKKERADDLLKKQFVSAQRKEQANTGTRIAEMRMQQAPDLQQIAERDLAPAHAQLARRTIRSPLTAEIVERFLSVGEQVEVFVPAAQFNQIKSETTVAVKLDLSGMVAQHARVTLIDRVLDPSSNTFRVPVSLPNPDSALPLRTHCKVDFSAALEVLAPAVPPMSALVKKPSADRAKPCPTARASVPKAAKSSPNTAAVVLR
jgi:multidrug efflux pump subunit AcrA (membrane-fusion protein)